MEESPFIESQKSGFDRRIIYVIIVFAVIYIIYSAYRKYKTPKKHSDDSDEQSFVEEQIEILEKKQEAML